MMPGNVALLGPANSIHLQRWAVALVGRGWRVSVITQHWEGALPLPPTVALHRLPFSGPLGYLANTLTLVRLLRALRPDLLNAHYASGYGTTMALSGFFPSLLSVWGSDVYAFPYRSAFNRSLLRWNLKRATAVASTSEAMARQVQRLVPDCQEVSITPFGVDMMKFMPNTPRCEGGPVTIGIVKLLAPVYGVDLLLRAFAGLVQDVDVRALPAGCRLLVVGDGPQRAALEALASTLGIGLLTQFVGAVAHADVPVWLTRLDIYAAPSRHESFGVAVVEASACGLPVVVSNVGGLPEVVLDGETGLIVPPDDAHALQQALKRLVCDPALRVELGRRGRAHVQKKYEWGHCVDLMERCYEQTLAVARAP